MRWHRVEERSGGGDGSKPSLMATMHHFDVDFNDQRGIGMAKCALHDDNTPSMSFRLDEGLWNCHSCGKGGDSYTLIIEYHRDQLGKEIDFKGAKDYARERAIEESAADPREEGYSSRYGGGHRAPRKRPGQKPGGGYMPAWKRR
ncbi:CHC2 zinc finger domain-containing protein [Streptomyces niveus]|uniref:CHC2 zinc finger domain-containing protein n=1 Tax=Streptomyces niveus TaxID=193462 RepID=UPI0035DECF3F